MIKRMVRVASGYQEKDVPYTLLKQNSLKLAVILPGRGYSVEAPLMFYSTSLLFSKGYDVLHINYQYNTEAFSSLPLEDQLKHIPYDIDSVIEEVLSANSYEDFCFVAKSIGTIGLSHLIQQERFERSQLVWLTPLITNDLVFDAMLHCQQPSISHIGDIDPVYDHERVNQLKENAAIDLRVINSVNHSLEFPTNIYRSLELLSKIINDIELFLERKNG